MDWIFFTLAAESKGKKCVKINIFLLNSKTSIDVKKIIAMQCLSLWRFSFKGDCLVKRDNFTDTCHKYTIDEKQPFVAFWIQWMDDFFFFLIFKFRTLASYFSNLLSHQLQRHGSSDINAKRENFKEFNWNDKVVFPVID